MFLSTQHSLRHGLAIEGGPSLVPFFGCFAQVQQPPCGFVRTWLVSSMIQPLVFVLTGTIWTCVYQPCSSSNQPSTILTVDISGEKFVSEERRLRLKRFHLRRIEHVFLSLFTMKNKSALGCASSPVSVGRSSSGMFRIFHKLCVSCRQPKPSKKLFLNYMLHLSVLEYIL